MEFKGLTSEEVDRSRGAYGTNALSQQDGESFWKKLLSSFGDPMIKILCVALGINVLFAFLGQTEWYESVGIAAAVIIATFVSTYSEYKNEGAFQKIQEEASHIICKVYRNSVLVEIPIDDIVVGDYVLLQSGDKVPADGFVIAGGLSVDQAALSGEAAEIKKVAASCDYNPHEVKDFLSENDLFRGSIVRSGNAVEKISSVGDKTVYGSIASELQDKGERDTPLKVKLTDLANKIAKFGYLGGITIAIAYLFQAIVIQNGFDAATIAAYCANWMIVANDVIKAVMLAVIIIVMAVPEGLPLMIAVVSSLNMGKMMRDDVLVREIDGIETAGSLNILFTDKTGTITKGHLEVVTFIDGNAVQYSALPDIPSPISCAFQEDAALNTAAVCVRESDGDKVIGGNATERALLLYLGKCEQDKSRIIQEIPFDSQRKFSAIRLDDSANTIYVKGAPEILLQRCSHYLDAQGAHKPLEARALNEVIDGLAEKTIRVIAFAQCNNKTLDDAFLESDGWTLIGLVGIRDEIRAESLTALKETRGAGIQVVMITGDRKETAFAIAKEVGLVSSPEDIVLTSGDLSRMSDEEIAEILGRIRVIARALPADKSRLVRIAQSKNLVVGMTGDGVNDSAALKKADVGFAMGSGTEVAKEAAEIVILDDNFNSIEKAILYGRTIFNSIRKFIVFQLTINIAAVLVSFVFPLLGRPNPLSIIQILWVNLVIDTLAGLAFGGEAPLVRYMKEKPKRRDEKIISGYMRSEIIIGAAWTFLVSLFFLLSPLSKSIFPSASNDGYLLTGYFCFFILTSIFNAFNARTDKLNLFDNIGKNKGFLKIFGLVVIVQIAMAYFGGDIFRCYGLDGAQWCYIIGLAFSIIPIDLVRKLYFQNKTIHAKDR